MTMPLIIMSQLVNSLNTNRADPVGGRFPPVSKSRNVTVNTSYKQGDYFKCNSGIQNECN